MNTTISFTLPRQEAVRTRKRAKQRGFSSVSEYLRYLIVEEQHDLISEDEILRRSQEAQRLYKRGKLKKISSLAELLDA